MCLLGKDMCKLTVRCKLDDTLNMLENNLGNEGRGWHQTRHRICTLKEAFVPRLMATPYRFYSLDGQVYESPPFSNNPEYCSATAPTPRENGRCIRQQQSPRIPPPYWRLMLVATISATGHAGSPCATHVADPASTTN